MTSRSTPLATFTFVALIGGWGSWGCWTGAESQGLPCANNRHCGLGLDCINGFCGGEPSLALCGNGNVDPGEACDDGEQNAEDGACRPDCTLETCGDGVQGPTEVCDDGGESPVCNDDCTLAACGDLKVNAAAGEECDNDSPASDDRLCMSNCTVPLLWDDMEPNTPPAMWTPVTVSGGVPNTWSQSDRRQQDHSTRGWDSGIPSATPGDIRLMTPELDLSVVGGANIEGFELRFVHARKFSDCGSLENAYEGAVVEVSVDGGPYQVITPTTGYTGVVGYLCEPDELNPLDGQEAYILDAGHTTEIFDLSDFAGSTITVGFRAGWDCGNCDVGADRGWFIDDVVVSRRAL